MHGWRVGVLVCALAGPAAASGHWEVIVESPSESLSLERASLDRAADRVSFRLRQVPRDGRLDTGSQRPVREILLRRVIDCRTRQTATLSRAVFSDHDALIHHEAVRQSQAGWQSIPEDDPLLHRMCKAL